MSEQESKVVPVYGLVLAGGQSSRMGEEKAALKYHGAPQAAHCHELLAGCCEKAFVSVREEQRENAAFAGLPQIHDRFVDFGPVAGILSAMAAHPEAAWLVVACDMPFVDRALLTRLLRARDPERLATVYVADDGLPEPLCAIYEPAIAQTLHAHMAKHAYSLRDALLESDVALLNPERPETLHDANSPEERDAARRAVREAAVTVATARTVEVCYYAILREDAGRTQEIVSTQTETVRDLFQELHERHGFSVGAAQLKVVVNEQFCDWTQPLNEGDNVVFIPPVAGG